MKRHERIIFAKPRIKIGEIDSMVVEVCRKYLPYLTKSLDDPRVNIKIGDGVAYISAIPCSKIKVGQAYKKWKKISAKKYIIEIIDAYGPADSVIQSLYDDFEKHNLDTDIITKIVEKEKKKSKSQIAKDKKKGNKLQKRVTGGYLQERAPQES